MKKKPISIALFFEHFPAYNDMYISEMVHGLSIKSIFKISLYCLKKSNYSTPLKITYIPAYYLRRVLERLYGLFNKKKKGMLLTEILWLKNKHDIVHVHQSFLFKHVLRLLELDRNNRPLVIMTLRGSDTYVRPLREKRWKDFYENYGSKMDAFVVLSQNQKKWLKKFGVPEKKIFVIPSSIKSLKASPRKLTRDKIKITTAMRMCWQKNIEGNIRVVKKLIERGMDVQYDIYGMGNDIGLVYHLIEAFELNGVVNVMGKVENDVYLEKLKTYDFYLQLSITESLSVSVIEAQSRGVPAIISNSGGMPETIIEGESGFSVYYYDIESACDRIVYLFQNQSVYEAFSKAAIENTKAKFFNEREVADYTKLYENLLLDKSQHKGFN